MATGAGVTMTTVDPRTIPLTPEQQKLLDEIKAWHFDALITAKQNYDDDVLEIHRRHNDAILSLLTETIGMNADQLAAWRVRLVNKK
jgi:hypothetical protein